LRPNLKDPDKWVQYGAVRSIIEVAAVTNELHVRKDIFDWLMQLTQHGELNSSALRELGRALDVQPQPEGWAAAVAPLIQQLVGTSETLAEQNQWGRVMTTILTPSESGI
jgi:hypothetical protein